MSHHMSLSNEKWDYLLKNANPHKTHNESMREMKPKTKLINKERLR